MHVKWKSPDRFLYIKVLPFALRRRRRRRRFVRSSDNERAGIKRTACRGVSGFKHM